MPSIPQSVVDKDHELEGRTERASEALAKHRWHWTLDESNADKVSTTAYARDIGRGHKLVSTYARGYKLFVERAGSPGGTALTIQDAIRLAGVAVEDRAMHEAIAEGSGRPVAQVSRGDNRHRTRAVVERAHQRAERRGGDAVDHARDIAAEERQVAEAERARRAADRERRSIRYVHIEGHLAAAQRRLLEPR